MSLEKKFCPVIKDDCKGIECMAYCIQHYPVQDTRIFCKYFEKNKEMK